MWYRFAGAVCAFGHLNKGWPTETEPSGGALPETDQKPAGDKLLQANYSKHNKTDASGNTYEIQKLNALTCDLL